MKLIQRTMCLALLAALCTPAVAGKLRQTDLPPDAKVVIHLDWDAARTSATFRTLAENSCAGLVDSGFVGKEAAELVAHSNLHDMTLVVTGSSGTFQIVRAETDIDSLREIFSDADGYVVVQHGDHQIHHWLDWPEGLKSKDDSANAEKSQPEAMYAATYGDGTYVISKQLRAVVDALDRFDGEGKVISESSFAAINYSAPANTVLLVHAASENALEPIIPGLPVKSGRAYIAVEGSVCEFACEAEMANAMLASMIANTLKAENLVAIFQAYAQQKAGIVPEPQKKEAQPEGKRALNFGFSFKNVDAETMHAMLAKAFTTTTDGAKIQIRFRGVVEPTVEIDATKLSISLQLDGAKTSTAAKDETIR